MTLSALASAQPHRINQHDVGSDLNCSSVVSSFQNFSRCCIRSIRTTAAANHAATDSQVSPLQQSPCAHADNATKSERLKLLCAGCGAGLQTRDTVAAGYIPSLTQLEDLERKARGAEKAARESGATSLESGGFSGHSIVCQRCFTAKNYGRIAPLAVPPAAWREYVSALSRLRRGVIVLVVDIFDLHDTLAVLKATSPAAAVLTTPSRAAGDLSSGDDSAEAAVEKLMAMSGVKSEASAGGSARTPAVSAKQAPKQPLLGPLPILVVVNKVDLLPRSLSPARLEAWVRGQINAIGTTLQGESGSSRSGGSSGAPAFKVLGVHCVSAAKQFGIRDLAASLQKHKSDVIRPDPPVDSKAGRGGGAGLRGELTDPVGHAERGDVYVVGAPNTGKSTLINALLTHVWGVPMPAVGGIDAAEAAGSDGAAADGSSAPQSDGKAKKLSEADALRDGDEVEEVEEVGDPDDDAGSLTGPGSRRRQRGKDSNSSLHDPDVLVPEEGRGGSFATRAEAGAPIVRSAKSLSSVVFSPEELAEARAAIARRRRSAGSGSAAGSGSDAASGAGDELDGPEIVLEVMRARRDAAAARASRMRMARADGSAFAEDDLDVAMPQQGAPRRAGNARLSAEESRLLDGVLEDLVSRKAAHGARASKKVHPKGKSKGAVGDKPAGSAAADALAVVKAGLASAASGAGSDSSSTGGLLTASQAQAVEEARSQHLPPVPFTTSPLPGTTLGLLGAQLDPHGHTRVWDTPGLLVSAAKQALLERVGAFEAEAAAAAAAAEAGETAGSVDARPVIVPRGTPARPQEAKAGKLSLLVPTARSSGAHGSGVRFFRVLPGRSLFLGGLARIDFESLGRSVKASDGQGDTAAHESDCDDGSDGHSNEDGHDDDSRSVVSSASGAHKAGGFIVTVCSHLPVHITRSDTANDLWLRHCGPLLPRDWATGLGEQALGDGASTDPQTAAAIRERQAALARHGLLQPFYQPLDRVAALAISPWLTPVQARALTEYEALRQLDVALRRARESVFGSASAGHALPSRNAGAVAVNLQGGSSRAVPAAGGSARLRRSERDKDEEKALLDELGRVFSKPAAAEELRLTSPRASRTPSGSSSDSADSGCFNGGSSSVRFARGFDEEDSAVSAALAARLAPLEQHLVAANAELRRREAAAAAAADDALAPVLDTRCASLKRQLQRFAADAGYAVALRRQLSHAGKSAAALQQPGALPPLDADAFADFRVALAAAGGAAGGSIATRERRRNRVRQNILDVAFGGLGWISVTPVAVEGMWGWARAVRGAVLGVAASDGISVVARRPLLASTATGISPTDWDE